MELTVSRMLEPTYSHKPQINMPAPISYSIVSLQCWCKQSKLVSSVSALVSSATSSTASRTSSPPAPGCGTPAVHSGPGHPVAPVADGCFLLPVSLSNKNT